MIANGANAIRSAARVLNRQPWLTILLALVGVAWLTTDDREFQLEPPEVELPSAHQVELVGRALYLGLTRLVPPETRLELERTRVQVERTVARIEGAIEAGRSLIEGVGSASNDDAELFAGGRRRVSAVILVPCG